MNNADPSVERFGVLLRRLKVTYGWHSIRAMPPEDLIVLLQRSSDQIEDQAFLAGLDPWLLQRLIDLLSTPPRQRERHLPALASTLKTSTEVIDQTLRRVDRLLALSRSDRNVKPPNGRDWDKDEETNTVRHWKPFLVAGLSIGVATGVALAVQIGRYRQEFIRQQQASREQKEELDRVKQQLQEAKEATSANQLPSQVPSPLDRPSLPRERQEPDRSTSADPSNTSVPPSSASSSRLRWSGCDRVTTSTSTPQSGDTWWPVVGPPVSLQAVQQHCRSDAFRNRDGNVQVASFPNRISAMAFAESLSADSSHPYTFYVGEPTIYD